MKPIILDNVIPERELFFLYNQIVPVRGWELTAQSTSVEYPSNKQFNQTPVLRIKTPEEGIINYPFYLYGQSLVYRISEMLNKKNIGINTSLARMWFNATYDSSESHWLHQDFKSSEVHTIVMFMTPVWQENWRGSFYVDGQEFKFKPGSAVIFDSREYHCGEKSKSKGTNWLRLTANIVVE